MNAMPNAARAVSPLRGSMLVGRGIWIELIRRKDLYVLAILMGFFALGALGATIVGIENADTATFLLNLGMSLAYYAAHGLALTLMARQVPDDIENRTVFPLLAKPVDRAWYLTGKWGAVVLGTFIAYMVLTLMGWLPSPKMGDYSGVLFLQVIVLQFLSITMLAAAVLLLSLIAPKGIVIVVGAILFLLGDKIGAFIERRFADTALETPVAWVVQYIPNFNNLNAITRYTDGAPALTGGEFLGFATVALVNAALFMMLAMLIFRRRPL